MIPISHKDILMKKTRAVLSTLDDAGVYSGYCWIELVDDVILVDSIDMEQKKHIESNNKVSVMTIDPENIDRWFCIQGIIEAHETSCYKVKIKKLILFPQA